MSNKELKELMSIICEGQDSEQRRKVENFIEYQVQLIDSLDKEIKRLKEEYVMLQNASDEVEEELQKRIDKALSYLRDIGNWLRDDSSYRAKLIDILQGSDKG